MAHTKRSELIWLSEFQERCPLSGGEIYGVDVELTVEAEDLLLVEWTMGRCDESNRWYGLMADLLGFLLEEDVPLATVDGFLIDDEAVQAGVWVGAPADVIPWDVVRDKLAAFEARPAGPPPAPKDVRALPLLSENWEVAVRETAWFIDENDEYVPSYTALVVDPAVGIRFHDLRGGSSHQAAELVPLILEAAARPRAGAPGRPLEIRLADEGLAEALGEALTDVDISVRAAPTPLADEVLDEMSRALGGEDEVPFFTPHDEQEVRAFFRTAKTFYGARPWDRIDGNKYIAFRFGDGPWGYLSVMGQMGEELGLSYFENWLQLCRFLHNQPTPWDYMTGEAETKAFEAAGALEGLTLEPMSNLSPLDAAYLKELGVKPPRKGLYPVVRRFTPEGLEPPRLSLQEYRTLMEALAQTLSKRRAQTVTSIKQTVSVGEVSVTLRFPARGDEGLPENPGRFRLIVSGMDPEFRQKPVRLEIDAPGDARLDEVAKAVKETLGSDFWVTGFSAGEDAVWSSRMGRGSPCPRVAQVASLPSLALDILSDPYPLQVMPLMAAGSSEIRVKYVGS